MLDVLFTHELWLYLLEKCCGWPAPDFTQFKMAGKAFDTFVTKQLMTLFATAVYHYAFFYTG